MLSSSIRCLPLRRLPPSLQVFCRKDVNGAAVSATIHQHLSPQSTTTTRTNTRFQSSSVTSREPPEPSYAFDEMGETTSSSSSSLSSATSETIAFPASGGDSSDQLEYQPVLLNSKEHAVGYLSRILNARVYEAAIETELQHAKNLSAVSTLYFFNM
jgi:hypothetical protein